MPATVNRPMRERPFQRHHGEHHRDRSRRHADSGGDLLTVKRRTLRQRRENLFALGAPRPVAAMLHAAVPIEFNQPLLVPALRPELPNAVAHMRDNAVADAIDHDLAIAHIPVTELLPRGHGSLPHLD